MFEWEIVARGMVDACLLLHAGLLFCGSLLFCCPQMAKDVVTFLSWAAEPEMDERKLVSALSPRPPPHRQRLRSSFWYLS